MRECTPEELAECIRKMHEAAAMFYCAAIDTGNHAFIEFTGLMNEYIKICELSAARGIDFTAANTHTVRPLPMLPHQAAYLGEKFDCIFGPTFRENPEVRDRFLQMLEK